MCKGSVAGGSMGCLRNHKQDSEVEMQCQKGRENGVR